MADDMRPETGSGDSGLDPILDEDAALDDSALAELHAALGEVGFLDPNSETETQPMPEGVWTGLLGAIHAEAASRAIAAHDNVAALPTRSSRTVRWAGGLVAASVALVAVGLAIGLTRGASDDVTIVAGSAPSVPAPAPTTTAGAEAFAADTMNANANEAAPAARIVLTSQTDYQHGELPGQVVSLVKNAGFKTPEEAMEKVVAPADTPSESGFTASWESLRDCITWLTRSSAAQALIVDRATYAGDDAGIVVAPATSAETDPATPSPTMTLDTRYGQFDVWVVNPECRQIEDALEDFALFQWKP